MDRAKQPITGMAGPYGHPFHPILVTIPIGAWVTGFVFDLISRGSDEPYVYTRGAWWLIAIGIIGALAAATVGFLDLLAIPAGTPARRTGLLHMGLNLAVVALEAIALAARSGRLHDPAGTGIGLIILAAVALVLLAASGWLGGKLAYRYGVRVVDEATQAEGFR
ncbi:MAG TPA: DUF2231 domain-containing protein [Acidimicrobiia bacterium]|nr:DUF2231 domain-containing protein [Acidimicrobiia bacterium]